MTREEAIKGLKVLAKDFGGYKPNEEMFDMAIKALEQPEQRSFSCGQENDLISRQAAIDVMLMAIDDDWEPDYATDRMNELPSAQPEPDTRLYSDGFDDGYKQAIKDAQPEHNPDDERKIADLHKMVNCLLSRLEQRWTPCSEGLPDEYGNYLITTHDGDVNIGTIDPKKGNVWSACDSDGFYWLREVIAWMPLPEGYRGEQE